MPKVKAKDKEEYLSSFKVSGNQRFKTAEVRRATADEVMELIEWCKKEYDAEWIADPEFVAVFPHYITDTPGYCGKVMVVVWGSGPGFTQTFYWEDGKIQEAKSEWWGESFPLVLATDEVTKRG